MQNEPTNPPDANAEPTDSADALQAELDATSAQLAEAQQTIANLERRNRIDALLREADAVDVDAARLLTEHTIEGMDEPDVQVAVADLRRHKPYLFNPPRQRESRGSAMAPRTAHEAADPKALAAEQAAETGNRRDLLRYLRLRRGA
ncbi:MAG: hypothetical protein MI741_22795 [Rhodospirillales bacterium]|nr:hypothetical protein [Rhodospirillales bacterium]